MSIDRSYLHSMRRLGDHDKKRRGDLEYPDNDYWGYDVWT